MFTLLQDEDSYEKDIQILSHDEESIENDIQVLPSVPEFTGITILFTEDVWIKENLEYPNVCASIMTRGTEKWRIKDGWREIVIDHRDDLWSYVKKVDIHSLITGCMIGFNRPATKQDLDEHACPESCRKYTSVFQYDIPENMMEEIALYCFNNHDSNCCSISPSSDLGKRLTDTLAKNIVEEENKDILNFKNEFVERMNSVIDPAIKKLVREIRDAAEKLEDEYNVPGHRGNYKDLRCSLLSETFKKLGIKE